VNTEIAIGLKDFPGIVGFTATVENRQGATAKQTVQSTGAGIEQRIDLQLGEDL
jgi:hypothetical protein